MASDTNSTTAEAKWLTDLPLPARTYFGAKAIEGLGQVMGELEARRLFVVVDRDAATAGGLEPILAKQLADQDVAWYDDFTPNPTAEEVYRGVAAISAGSFDAIVCVGGGSALDMGKLIGIASAQPVEQQRIFDKGQAPSRNARPIVAVPTTAGTGAEATHFSAVYVDGCKQSIAHPSMLPIIAVVDPQLTCSMPPPVTAATGLDALCQGIESMWAVGSTDQSRVHAARAVELAMANLDTAVNQPNPTARRDMSLAAHLAGRAINISKTTAPHALSYTLTARHNVPHGCAVALTIGAMLRYNGQVTSADCVDPRGIDHVRASIDQLLALLGAATVDEAAERLDQLIESIGCPTTLNQVGVKGGRDVEQMAAMVNAERLSNNPRRLDRASAAALLKGLL